MNTSNNTKNNLVRFEVAKEIGICEFQCRKCECLRKILDGCATLQIPVEHSDSRDPLFQLSNQDLHNLQLLIKNGTHSLQNNG